MSTSNHISNVSLTATIPTDVQIPYTPPSIPTLLSLSTFIVLLAVPTLLSNSYPVHFVHSQDRLPDGNDTKSRSYNLDPSLTIILPLLLGALLGPSITSNSILSSSDQGTLMNIGYIGLLLLIFEAGVSLDATSLRLMRNNVMLSVCVAVTGALIPIAISMGLGTGAYGYSKLQSFASGASLASTSLGTTLSLLAPAPTPKAVKYENSNSGSESDRSPMDLRRTRVGCVLVCAALLDDILGLVIAGIIPGLAQADSESHTKVEWPTIVRLVLVSVAFGLVTPLSAMGLRWILNRFSLKTPRPQYLFIVIVLSLMAFTAGSGYAGTSELFGAYLAGAFASHIFPNQSHITVSSPEDGEAGLEGAADESGNAVHAAFIVYLQPILTHLLSPLFFGSIGVALPIKALFTTYPGAVQITRTVQFGSNSTTDVHVDSGSASHRVIWRGLVYGVLMVLAKMVVGLWMLIWPLPKDKELSTSPCPSTATPESTTNYNSIKSHPPRPFGETPLGSAEANVSEPETRTVPIGAVVFSGEPTRTRSALLLGLAMVARGEIALIVAQLARPLLVRPAAPSTTTTSASGMETTTITRDWVSDEEPFAVVIWAILISTVGGAVGVGVLVASWKRRSRLN